MRIQQRAHEKLLPACQFIARERSKEFLADTQLALQRTWLTLALEFANRDQARHEFVPARENHLFPAETFLMSWERFVFVLWMVTMLTEAP
jgi:hypothetical protein